MSKPLSDAPEHVQLAVDLIYLLEQHQLDADTVVKALDIVRKDFARKQNLGGNPTSHTEQHISTVSG